MTEIFKNVGYYDIARNFEMVQELKEPQVLWTLDPHDEDRDQELKKGMCSTILPSILDR